MSSLLQDIRYAIRQLRRAPVFALTSLLTMALAIGATAALSGVLRATLWNRLPYPDAQQLVAVSDHNKLKFAGVGLTSVPRTVDLAGLQHNGHTVFAALAFYYRNNDSLILPGRDPQPVLGGAVTGNFFSTMGAKPLLGRVLLPADDVSSGPLVTVLSYGLWQSTFAGDPAVVGRTMRLGDQQASVVGVMPARFDLPTDTALWYPARISANFGGYRGGGSRFVQTIARLDEHETPQTARVAANQLAEHLAIQYPTTDAAWDFDVTPLGDMLFGEYRHALQLLLAAVALVLMVAAANLAGLQLARNASRQAEFSIRGALGITRGRLLRQLLTENLLLVFTGSALGLVAAIMLLRVLVSRLPPELLLVDRPHVDVAVCVAAMGIAAATGVLASLMPWVRAARLFATGAQASGQRIAGAPAQRSGNLFVLSQIALSLVLLMVAGALLQRLYALLHTRLGFDAAQVSTFTVDLSWRSQMPERHQLYSTLEQQISALPGVAGVGAMSALPLSGFSVRLTYDIAGRSPTPSHDTVVAEGRDISLGYPGAMHIPLLAGRMFTAQDAQKNAPRTFLANHAFAQHYFPGESALGHHLTSTADELQLPPGSPNSTDAGEIVGILGDVQGTGGTIGKPARPELYRVEMGGWPHLQFAVRSAGPDPTLETQIRRLVAQLSPTASVSHFDTFTSARDRTEVRPRLIAALLAAFGMFALLLTAVGTYGLAAFNLAQRGREFAVRMALGSTRTGIVALLLRHMLRLLGVGLVTGLLGGLAALRVLASTTDASVTFIPASFFAVIALVSLAVLAAVAGPARRAAATNPIAALRAE